MKTKLLLLAAITAVFFQFTNAQCTEDVENFGNNINIPMYNILGDVSVTLNTNNTVTLDLGTNFMTADGPDVRAYLVKSNGIPDATLRNTLISNLDNIEFGLVGALPGFGNPTTPINGAKTFTVDIPTGENIEDYDKIFFYCLMFNQFWDLGTFTIFNAANCNFLSVEENSLKNISIYPNPTSEKINIKGLDNKTINIKIYDVLGKKVLDQNLNTSQTINVSELNKGVYILKANTENKTKTQRLVIQ